MANRTPLLGLAGGGTAAALLFTALRFVSPAASTVVIGRGEPTAAHAESTRADSAAADSSARRTARQLLDDFLHSPLDRTVSDSIGPYRLGVAIATLPDPLDSHLDWEYDAGLESIRRAYERADYVIDRFWLPWSPTSDTTLQHPSHGRPLRARYPGVILFRARNPLRRELRVVYIVGEVPTGGIAKEAFAAALAERDVLLSSARKMPMLQPDPTDTNVLRVIGPAFSGSSTSIARSLVQYFDARRNSTPQSARRSATDAPDKPRCDSTAPFYVRVISGAATNDANRRLFATVHGPGWCVDFNATTHSDRTLAPFQRRILKQLGYLPREIATLRETTTQYGQLSLKDSSTKQDPSGRNGATDSDTADSTVNLPLEIPFSMNISSLRSEYARDLSRSLQPDAQLTVPTPEASNAGHLPLDLRDPAWASEHPPVLSTLTASSVESALDEDIRTLIAHRIKVVQILATDIRDKLFLATMLRQRMPDVQVVLFGANDLLANAELNGYLRGTLVISTYPLVVESQFWDLYQSNRQRISFTSEQAEGIFNATLLQLRDDSAMTDYDVPLDSNATRSAAGPPVWVTVVGEDQLLPVVATFDSLADDSGYLARRPLSAYPRHHAEARSSEPQFYTLYALLLVGFVVVFVVWHRHTRRHSTALDTTAGAPPPAPLVPADPDSVTLARLAERTSLVLQRELYAFLGFVALAGIFLPLLLVLFRAKAHGTEPPLSYILIVPAVLLTLGAIWPGVGHAVRANFRSGWDYTWRRAPAPVQFRTFWRIDLVARLGALALGLLFAVMIGWFTRDVLSLRYNAPLFFDRAVAIQSGVSPLLPLLMIGIALAAWAHWHLRRIAMLSVSTAFEQTCLGPAAGLCDVGADADPGRSSDSGRFRVNRRRVTLSSPRLQAAIQSIRRVLFLVVPSWTAGVVVLLMLISGLWLAEQCGRSLESLVLPFLPGTGLTTFDVLLRFGLATAIGGMILLLYRFLNIWHRLRSVLDEVADTRLRDAFSRLPPPVGRLMRLTPFDPMSDVTIENAIATRWRRMKGLYFRSAMVTAPDKPEATESLMKENGSPERRSKFGEPPVGGLELCRFFHALDAEWRRTQTDEPTHDAPPGAPAPTPAAGTTPASDPSILWLRTTEECTALYVVDYLDWTLAHLRALALFLLVSLLTTTLLVYGYPFQPQSLIRSVFVVVFVATVAVLLFVIAQMNQNEILSRIAKTVPGQVTWDTSFVVNLVLFAAVPILTLLSAQFPAIRAAVSSWIEPTLHALGK